MVSSSRPRAVVVGAGLTGVAVRRHLQDTGYEVEVIDDSVEKLTDQAIGDLVQGADLVYPSAGVKPSHAAWTAAAAHDVPVVGELDLAQRVSDLPIVAVTASNGKTTITTLITAMLEESGIKAVAAGNIGYPLIEAVKAGPEMIVAEVSSFQLYAAKEFRATVALWANAAPNHLDWHGTWDEYVAAKARIFRNQGRDDHAVANLADPVVMEHARAGWARLTTFGPGGTFRVQDDFVVRQTEGGRPEPIVAVAELPRALPHDLDNALAALAAAACAGADLAACADALREFEGLPHRVELVGEAGGVRWFNDSKATTPESVKAALSGFESVILIAGGRNKGVDLSVMAEGSANVRAVVAIGEAAGEIEAAFAPATAVAKATSMDDAVTRASCLARSGDVVLLSPGCASYDWYGSYAERGDDFRRAVTDVLARAS
jgi:UDP-N-acetylmuramoylalanine--D-glutamate ligase